jgi:hypothetical protein
MKAPAKPNVRSRLRLLQFPAAMVAVFWAAGLVL